MSAHLNRYAATSQRRNRTAWLAVVSVSCVSVTAIAQEQARELEVVVVTAQKRTERLQDVPVPVTALNADSLAGTNKLRLQDYFSTVPGFSVVPTIQSNQTLSIRGITTGAGNPTVGIIIDDMPFGASTGIGGGRAVPDIDPGDLARVEILRGPQGTLYGASALGGLLKFVTRDPATDELAGRIELGSTSVRNGDELGYNVRASVNLPLSNTWAVRASAFTRRDPGYVDNVQTAEDAVNTGEAKGARMAALWQPSEQFSVKLSALVQEFEQDGTPSVDIALADLQQSRLRDTGWFDRKTQAYSATVTAALGKVDLTSISGYNVNSYSDSLDISYLLANSAQTTFGVRGVALVTDSRTEKFSQEVRLSIPLSQKIDWLVGAFYTDEDSSLSDTRPATDVATGVRAGTMSRSVFPTTYEEYALFTDVTYHATDRFDVQVGARQSEITQTYREENTNAQGVRSAVAELEATPNAFTYLVTPSFKLSPDMMLYARFASGYRAGGANINAGGIVPAQYDPDKTQNYELGIKGDFFDRMFYVEASVYRIDWKDIQLLLVSPAAFGYTINGSEARSQGIELSVEARPLPGLTAAGWVVLNESELTEALSSGAAGTAVGASGDRLPNSSRISGNLSLDQEFSIGSNMTATVGGSVSYIGDRVGPFRAVALRQEFPSYAQVDLRAGLEYDTWSTSLFVTNVGDKRGTLYGGLGANPPTAFNYIQPRTIGMSLRKSF